MERLSITVSSRDALLVREAGLPPGFRLDRLAVVVSMTGSEWPITGRLAEEKILPQLAYWGIRLVQVARSGPLKGDGVTILSDTDSPDRLYLDGDYALAEEMLTAGTIPQLGGARKCSQKSKGMPIDEVLYEITGGGPFWQIMGFEACEAKRAAKDARANSPSRTGVYPLISWGWDRETCQAFLLQELGVWWPKSACTFCPFALSNRRGRDRVLRGFAADPTTAWESLLMETVAEALNPSQTLLADQSLYELMAATPGQAQVLRLFEQRVARFPWALVEVRRVITSPGRGSRALTVGPPGTRSEALAALEDAARSYGVAIDRTDRRHPRAWLERRTPDAFPAAEHLFVAVPATVATKVGPSFARDWASVQAAALRQIPP